MFRPTQQLFKASELENATVFCISGNGVTEGHHFLTLISWHATPRCKKTFQYRSRTFSLPPSFDKVDLDDNDDGVDFIKLSRSMRSLSDDILRLSRQQQTRRNVCIECVSALKLCDDSVKRIHRSVETARQKVKHKGPDSIRINVASKSKMHKSLVRRQKQEKGSPCSAVSVEMDGYMLSYFITELRRSSKFRSSFLQHWSKGGNNCGQREAYPLLVFLAVLKHPKHEMLDLLGNKMVNSNILYRRSLEHALSWLSTLGGAFSALGDLSPSWAEAAGHVSLTQLRIALKLGDPGIQSRCRLYAAISLLQRGYLKSCRDIVRNEYQYAKSLPEDSDPRLLRMCLGVWSKLQYHWKQVAKSDKRMLKSSLDGLKDIQNNSKYWSVYDLEEGRRIASVEEN